MSIETIYNSMSGTYNKKVSAHVLNQAKQLAKNLMIKEPHHITSILSLGVGDGTDLLPYKEHYTNAQFHGLDISENMLKKAAALVHCKTYHGDISQASSIIQQPLFDLIIAHFVTAYVPLQTILNESKKMLQRNGLISILTNTKNSFPFAQKTLLPKIQRSWNPINKLVAYHSRKSLETVYVPTDLNDLKITLESNGFEIKELEFQKIPFRLSTTKDIIDFFIGGSWFASGLNHPWLPAWLLEKQAECMINKYYPTPYEDTVYIAIAIAQYKQ